MRAISCEGRRQVGAEVRRATEGTPSGTEHEAGAQTAQRLEEKSIIRVGEPESGFPSIRCIRCIAPPSHSRGRF